MRDLQKAVALASSFILMLSAGGSWAAGGQSIDQIRTELGDQIASLSDFSLQSDGSALHADISDAEINCAAIKILTQFSNGTNWVYEIPISRIELSKSIEDCTVPDGVEHTATSIVCFYCKDGLKCIRETQSNPEHIYREKDTYFVDRKHVISDEIVENYNRIKQYCQSVAK